MDASTSPSSPIRQSLLSLMPGHRRRPAPTPSNQSAITSAPTPSNGLSNILRGRAPPVDVTPPQPTSLAPIQTSLSVTSSSIPLASGTGRTHRIRLVPLLENSRSLHFEPIVRDAVDGGPALKIGRFTDRQSTINSTASATTSLKIAFKSKVVSRGHAEIWSDINGKFSIKDTKSSSGTFLNHIRLSPPNTESRPFSLKDGDVIQLGVDYQGGAEEVYRCVKIRVEVGREWQAGANAFNVSALKQIHSLSSGAAAVSLKGTPASTSDCCICLYPVTVCQALFITPCSHAYHFKCIRPLINQHFPGFSCPLCRTFADLEADVEIDQAGPLTLDITANNVEGLADVTQGPIAQNNAVSSTNPSDSVDAALSDVEEAEVDADVDAMITDRGEGDDPFGVENDEQSMGEGSNASVAGQDSAGLGHETDFGDELVTPQTTNFVSVLADHQEHYPPPHDGEVRPASQEPDDGSEGEGFGLGSNVIHFQALANGGAETLTGPGPSRLTLAEGGVVGAKRKR